jgi:hypothetical protein
MIVCTCSVDPAQKPLCAKIIGIAWVNGRGGRGDFCIMASEFAAYSAIANPLPTDVYINITRQR